MTIDVEGQRRRAPSYVDGLSLELRVESGHGISPHPAPIPTFHKPLNLAAVLGLSLTLPGSTVPHYRDTGKERGNYYLGFGVLSWW